MSACTYVDAQMYSHSIVKVQFWTTLLKGLSLSLAQPNDDQVVLTAKQLELIHSTWELVKPNMQEAGLTMFYK